IWRTFPAKRHSDEAHRDGANYTMHLKQKRPKVFYGWWIVGACFVISVLVSGIVNLGFTAFFEPITKEFGWSYAQISLAASLRGVELGILAPLVGFLIDRWGLRRLMVGGSILVASGFLLFSRVSSLGMFYLAFALIAIGMSTCVNTALMIAVANWFRKRLGLVVGIVTSGVGLGGFLVPIITMLIDTLGWRTAVFILGLSILVTILPLSLLIRHKPEQYGYLPDGEVSTPVEVGEPLSSPKSVEISISANQAIRSRVFWHIALAIMALVFAVYAVITHIMPYLSSIGIIRSTSSLVALAIPMVSIFGRLGAGWLSDRIGRRRVFVLGFILITMGMLFFSYAGEAVWLLVPFVFTFSVGWGAGATTRVALLRQYFGRASFGTILGFVSGVAVIGTIAGPPVAGWVFDTWGSYQGIWLAIAALTLTAVVLTLTMPHVDSTIQAASKG
ncbi:MFS transporter, partial [Chloroflexota bacterium]